MVRRITNEILGVKELSVLRAINSHFSTFLVNDILSIQPFTP